MTEKKIYLSPESLVDFYGNDSRNANRIKTLFPKLKLVFRGNEIKVSGNEKEIKDFFEFIENLKLRLERYNKLGINEINLIFEKKINPSDVSNEVILYGNNGKPVYPRSESQKKFVRLFDEKDLIFATGPAGTGKTYLAIALAVRSLKNNEVKRIILSRPAVEAGESLGFLPGDMKEKLDPYLQALYDALFDIIPASKLNKMTEQGIIQIAPLAYMRGRTLSNAVVVLDEAQNTSISQLKMFLTRMGENSKFIVTGDTTQIDLPEKTKSGLVRVKKILKDVKGIGFIDFKKSDIVRHPLVSPIVEAFEREGS